MTKEDVEEFEKIIPGRVVTDEDELLPHNTDWLKMVRYILSDRRELKIRSMHACIFHFPLQKAFFTDAHRGHAAIFFLHES